jgi:ATP-dependent helicase/nuclease subunit B
MSEAPQPAVYTIPPDVAFLPALVRAILSGRLSGGIPPEALQLSRWTILLPTRRACRSLREAFIETDPETPRILPVIRPIGDVDEDEAVITSGFEDLDLPPAAAPVERQFLLARLVRQWAQENPAGPAASAVSSSMAQALRMAASLMQLIDSLDTGEISLAEVPTLLEADPELPLHGEQALGFLRIIASGYPAAMQAAGKLGPQDRRARLLRMEAERLAANSPAAPVIAAGSTGSLPATAQLLKAVSRLPQGCVVLPGLDQQLDDESWLALDEQHPQFGMRELLKVLEVDRRDVGLLPHLDRREDGHARELLASEIMRPGTTTHLWKQVSEQAGKLAGAMTGISLLEAPEMREQALMIALAMRKALDEQRPCALVTPDRQLAKRVSAELARWNIHVDDSAGEPLSIHPHGIFFELVAAAVRPDAAPEQVTALLTHSMVGDGVAAGDSPQRLARELEIVLFRQVMDGHRLDQLVRNLQRARAAAAGSHVHPAVRRLAGDESWQALAAHAARLEAMFAAFCNLARDDAPQPLAALLETHIRLAESLAADADGKPDRMWTGEAGAALSACLRELLDHAAQAPAMRFSDYCIWLADCLRQVPVRRRYPLHPQLSILGLLEARLVQPDVVILGGLNEGVWPAAADPGPWLSRHQHGLIDLQPPERRLGLAAHDFVQSLCAGEVKLAWTRKAAGTPLVPSRWLMRLKAVLEAAGLKQLAEPGRVLLDMAMSLDGQSDAKDLPPEAPAPKPPVKARPKRLSVTRVARLLHDPYWAYAYYVLGLQPLPPLGQRLGPAERGQLAHKVLERFCRRYPGPMPDNAAAILQAIAAEEAEAVIPDPAVRAIWLPQLNRAVDWFAGTDADLRANASQIHVEVEGELAVTVGGETFRLSGKADRIDELQTGEGRIIDYKTGQATFSGVTAQDYSPQLDLEGWMLADGAFPGIGAMTAAELMYIRVSGGQPAGEVIRPKDKFPVAERIDTARSGFVQLMAMYQRPERGYPARTGAEAWNRLSDYDHLSRWREWGLGRDGGDGEGGEE